MMNWIGPHEYAKRLVKPSIGDNKLNLVPVRSTRSLRRQCAHAAVSGLAIVVVTFSGYELHVNGATAALLCLLVVVWQSLEDGFAISAAVSLFAAGCLDFFFLPPLL